MCNEKTVSVENDNGTNQTFNIVNVRPYIEDSTVVSSSEIPASSGSPTSNLPLEIHITEILQLGNPRLKSSEVLEARRKEIRGLISKNAFRAVPIESLQKNANILSGRFVDAIKNPGTPDELYKSTLSLAVTRIRTTWYTASQLYPKPQLGLLLL